jgi:hypothetical protein
MGDRIFPDDKKVAETGILVRGIAHEHYVKWLREGMPPDQALATLINLGANFLGNMVGFVAAHAKPDKREAVISSILSEEPVSQIRELAASTMRTVLEQTLGDAPPAVH